MATPRVTRTFSMLGADGAGKTALVEALLRLADPRHASPDGSSARLDAEPEEKKRNFTLSLHPESFEEGGRSFHVLDCPGFAAFLTEVEWALQVTDGAVMAVSAADGCHNRAERTYDVLADSGVPALGLIARVDHDQADFQKALADIEASLKVKPVALQVPIGSGPGCRGLVDLASMKAHLVDPKAFGRYTEAEVPAELVAEATALRTVLMEAAAEADDECWAATSGRHPHRGGCAAGWRPAPGPQVPAVAVAAAKTGLGIRELLDLAVVLFPARPSGWWPARPRRQGGDLGGQPNADSAARSSDFIDHFTGQMTTSASSPAPSSPRPPDERTRSGRVSHLRTDGLQTAGCPRPAGQFVVWVEDAHPATPSATAGRHPAPAFRQHTLDLPAVHARRRHRPRPPPQTHRGGPGAGGGPLARHRGDAAPGWAGPHRGDRGARQAEARRGVTLAAVPAYLETIRSSAKAQGRHKRQTGGHGQFGDCWLELSPLPRGGGFEFEDAIVGHCRQFIPAVEKGSAARWAPDRWLRQGTTSSASSDMASGGQLRG
jgi:elongation factor G